jgi:ABC-2 type transport system permease protein
MRPVLSGIVKETRLLLRDPVGIAMLFVMPAVFILVLSATLQGVFSSNMSETLDIVVVNEDRGEAGERILEGLRDAGHFRVTTSLGGKAPTLDEALASLSRRETKIVLHIPARTTAAARFEGEARLEVFTDPTLSAEFTALLEAALETCAFAATLEQTGERAASMVEGLDALREANTKLKDATQKLADATSKLRAANDELVEANGKLIAIIAKMKRALDKVKKLQALAASEGIEMPPGFDMKGAEAMQAEGASMKPPEKAQGAETGEEESLDALDEIELPEEVKVEEGGFTAEGPAITVRHTWYGTGEIRAVPNSVQQTVPGWTLFALFWICQTIAMGMIQERKSGAYRRLLVSPLGPSQFVAGKVVPFFILNMIQAAVLFGLGVAVLPLLGLPALELREPWGLALLTAVFSFVSIGFGILVAAFSKTNTVAAVMTAMISVVMAALGGVMVPRFIMPRALQTAALLVPHGWALEGYLDLLVRGARTTDILPHACVLALFGLGFFMIAFLRQARRDIVDE